MRTIKYKDYQASVEFDNGSLFVKVLHIDDLLIAECDKASDAEATLRGLVEDYLQDCAEEGREPSKPFKGTFNVRISPEQHKRAAMAAAETNQSLNSYIAMAIGEKLECSKLSERIDGVFSQKHAEMAAQAQVFRRALQSTAVNEPYAPPGHFSRGYTAVAEEIVFSADIISRAALRRAKLDG